jgi:predicted N-acyltransferase
LLHFEACYYQAIEYAIAHRLKTFEGGAQGEHKLFRGLMPVRSVSAHWLAEPRFFRAIEDYLERETAGVGRYVNELEEHSPFKA